MPSTKSTPTKKKSKVVKRKTPAAEMPVEVYYLGILFIAISGLMIWSI